MAAVPRRARFCCILRTPVQISELDLYYLDDEELARQLIELGYRGAGDVLKREEFEARKKADREKYLHKDVAPKPLSSMGKDLSASPFLQGT